MPKPPNGFTALQWAVDTSNKPYDTMGVCIDYMEPAKSRGSDYTSKFVLRDPSWVQTGGMKFRFFQDSIDKLPKIQSNGDVVILRNAKTKEFNHQSIGMLNSSTTWVVLSGSSILESTCPDGSDITFVASRGFIKAPIPTAQELKYAKEIVNTIDPSDYRPPPKSTALDVETRMVAAGGTPLQRKDKWRLIQDLDFQFLEARYSFADLFGEVRKSWYNDFGRVDLSITDFTSNKLLYNYSNEKESRDGDAYGYTGMSEDRWPGPWGRMTITVLLHDAHAVFAKSQVKPGMFVLIKNCHIKLDRNGTKLEAVCRGDRDDPSKVNVLIYKPQQADNPRFRDLLKRRHEYAKLAKSQGLRFELEKGAHQASYVKSLEKIETEGEDKERNTEVATSRSKSKRRRGKVAKQKVEAIAAIASLPNQHVRCNNIDVPLKSIDDILDLETLKRQTPEGHDYHLPFQNCSYKCKVRVVDYYPHNLADFSASYLVSEPDSSSNIESTGMTEHAPTADHGKTPTIRWEWRFFLIVEDATARAPSVGTPRQQMALLVADHDGDYLLDAVACDLNAEPQELGKLREKLFVLWGDLQERKEEATSSVAALGIKAHSKPFECFIKEYGVPVPSPDGRIEVADTNYTYQRMFRLFGTTI